MENLFIEDNVLYVNINKQELLELNTLEKEGKELYITIPVTDENIDILFPYWKNYVDIDNVLETLNEHTIHAIKRVCLEYDETIFSEIRSREYLVDDTEIIPTDYQDNGESIKMKLGESVDDLLEVTFYFEAR